MIRYGWFRSHSGLELPWKIELDEWPDFVWRSIAELIGTRVNFSDVIGVPTGGLKLARYLEEWRTKSVVRRLIVDDVLTTGASMEALRRDPTDLGVVVFARGPLPTWVLSIFTVSEWAQNPLR